MPSYSLNIFLTQLEMVITRDIYTLFITSHCMQVWPHSINASAIKHSPVVDVIEGKNILKRSLVEHWIHAMMAPSSP